MIIDVLISSAAKPALLEKTLESLEKKFMGGHHTFRFILLEFRVGKNNRSQQQASYSWIKKNRNKFDEVVLINKFVDDDLWFKEILERAKSDHFLYIRGNAPLSASILLDVIIALMAANYDEIPQIVFNNGEITKKDIIAYEDVDGYKFGQLNFFSKSAGVFNKKPVIDIFDLAEKENFGFDKAGLTKASNKLGYKNYVLADRKKHIDIISGV